MKGLKWAGRIIRGVVTAVLAMLLAGNLYLLAAEHLFGVSNPTVFGFTTAVVSSGSMEPALQVDDLILVRTQECYAEGDIITFQSGSSRVTHRIVGENEEGFVTKGDANNAADRQSVDQQEIVGKVVGRLPGVGVWIGWLRTPLGMTCLVLVGLLLVEMPYLLRRKHWEDGKEGEVQA